MDRAYVLYAKYLSDAANEEISEESLDALYDASQILTAYIDEVDDIYYKVLFASVLKEMLESNQFNMPDELRGFKIKLYFDILQWCAETNTIKDRFAPMISNILIDFGSILLKGIEVQKNDNVAWVCFYLIKNMGYDVDFMLNKFEIGPNGQKRYIGTV